MIAQSYIVMGNTAAKSEVTSRTTADGDEDMPPTYYPAPPSYEEVVAGTLYGYPDANTTQSCTLENVTWLYGEGNGDPGMNYAELRAFYKSASPEAIAELDVLMRDVKGWNVRDEFAKHKVVRHPTQQQERE